MNNLFLIALTDRDKKILAVLAILFVLVFIIVGLLFQWMRTRMKKNGESIYEYLYDLNKYKIITSPQELIECVRKKESRYLYRNTRLMMRILFLFIIGTIIYFENFQNGDYSLIKKSLDSLSFKLDWPTSKFWGLNLISGFPTVAKYPEPVLTLYGFISYILVIIVIVWFVVVVRAILNYLGRVDFAKTVAKEKFFKSLEEKDSKNSD